MLKIWANSPNKGKPIFGLSGFPLRKENGLLITDKDSLARLASVWATKWDGSWPYQVHNGYFYLYYEDEQRVLTDSNLVFSVKATKVFAFAIGLSQTLHQL